MFGTTPVKWKTRPPPCGASMTWAASSHSAFVFVQVQPDADVLAVQPKDASHLPGDHRDAARQLASHLPGRLLLLQRGEQAARERRLWPGHGEHGEHTTGPVLLLTEGTVFGQRRDHLHGPEGQLRGAPHLLHTHERGKDKRTNTGPAEVQPLLTIPPPPPPQNVSML